MAAIIALICGSFACDGCSTRNSLSLVKYAVVSYKFQTSQSRRKISRAPAATVATIRSSIVRMALLILCLELTHARNNDRAANPEGQITVAEFRGQFYFQVV
jgi:hypothetical protein